VVTNLILAMVWALAFVVLGLIGKAFPAAATVLDTAQRMMVYGIWLNLVLCFFNLIPVPPLDGSHIMYHLLPPRAGDWYRGLQRFGYLPIFALMFLFRPVMMFLLAPAFKGMMLLLQLLYPFRVGDGWNIFRS
jgi:Zn-dependent protease